MKKLLLLITFFMLSGCSYFTGEPDSLTADQSAASSATTESTSVEEEVAESTESFPDNDTFNNVFNETAIGQDRYPETSLPDTIPISELRIAINEFYETVLTEDEKELNYDKVDGETLQILQQTFSNNEVYKPLEITVDQIEMELGGKTNYIARIVIGMTHEEAEAIIDENDILVLNEALAHLDNRIVLVAYYDEEAGTLLPYHLNNTTNSLFSLANQSDSSSDSSTSESEAN